MQEYWFNEMITKYRNDFYKICGIDLISIIEDKMLQLINQKNIEYSIGHIVTIEDSDQNRQESYEMNMVQLIRDLLISCNVNDIKSDIHRFISSEHSIFRRLIIHLINIKRFRGFALLIYRHLQTKMRHFQRVVKGRCLLVFYFFL